MRWSLRGVAAGAAAQARPGKRPYGLFSPIPVAADESALCLTDVAGLVGPSQVMNIKLDKCGGLTKGLRWRASRRLGLRVMGASVGLQPRRWRRALLSGNSAMWSIWIGAMFLSKDHPFSMKYVDGTAWSDDRVWGAGETAPA